MASANISEISVAGSLYNVKDNETRETYGIMKEGEYIKGEKIGDDLASLDAQLAEVTINQNNEKKRLFSSRSVAPVEETTKASKTYTVGEILVMDGSLYNVCKPILTGEDIKVLGAERVNTSDVLYFNAKNNKYYSDSACTQESVGVYGEYYVIKKNSQVYAYSNGSKITEMGNLPTLTVVVKTNETLYYNSKTGKYYLDEDYANSTVGVAGYYYDVVNGVYNYATSDGKAITEIAVLPTVQQQAEVSGTIYYNSTDKKYYEDEDYNRQTEGISGKYYISIHTAFTYGSSDGDSITEITELPYDETENIEETTLNDVINEKVKKMQDSIAEQRNLINDMQLEIDGIKKRVETLETNTATHETESDKKFTDMQGSIDDLTDRVEALENPVSSNSGTTTG